MLNWLAKYKQIEEQKKAALWFLICGIIQNAVSFVTAPIFTRLMTTEEYGVFSLYMSWFMIFSIITALYLYAGIFTNAMNKFPDDRDTYVSSMQGITTLITGFLFLLFMITQDTWCNLLGLEKKYIYLLFLELLFTPGFSFWSSKMRYTYGYRKLVALTILKSLITPISGILCVLAFPEQKAFVKVLSFALSESVISGVLYIHNFAVGKTFYVKGYWKYALGMAIPLLPHYLAGMILNQGDRIVIDYYHGKGAVALYGVACSLGMLLQIVTNALGNSMAPWIYDKINKKDYSSLRKTIGEVIGLSMLASLCLMLVCPELILLFGKENYEEATKVIPFIVASAFFIYLYSVIATIQFYYEKTKFMMVVSVLVAGLNIGLNILFVKNYGYFAAGVTTLFCYILYCVGHLLFSSYIAKKYNGGENIYQTGQLIVFSGLVIFFSIGDVWLISYPIVRYVVLLVALLSAWFMRKRIGKLLHKNVD